MSWCSQLQRAVATSSCESEIYSLTDVVKEVLYLRLLLEDMTGHEMPPSKVWCDNQAAVQICSGRYQTLTKLRHIRDLKRFLDIRRRFIQGQKQEVSIHHCRADKMLADLMTKPLGSTKVGQINEKILERWSEVDPMHQL